MLQSLCLPQCHFGDLMQCGSFNNNFTRSPTGLTNNNNKAQSWAIFGVRELPLIPGLDPHLNSTSYCGESKLVKYICPPPFIPQSSFLFYISQFLFLLHLIYFLSWFYITPFKARWSCFWLVNELALPWTLIILCYIKTWDVDITTVKRAEKVHPPHLHLEFGWATVKTVKSCFPSSTVWQGLKVFWLLSGSVVLPRYEFFLMISTRETVVNHLYPAECVIRLHLACQRLENTRWASRGWSQQLPFFTTLEQAMTFQIVLSHREKKCWWLT